MMFKGYVHMLFSRYDWWNMLIEIFVFVFIYWLFRYIIVPVAIAIINFRVLTLAKRHVTVIKASGKWAVVTGSTDGIGREYCRQLAKLGLNLFLVSRDEAKLVTTTNELKHYYKIEVKYFQADFTQNSIYDRLHEELRDLDIGLLVNNVGMTQKSPSTYHNLNEDFSFLTDILNCNILSAVAMTKIVLPGMCQRKRGIIINISSGSILMTMPMSALYSSTKACLFQFSMTTHRELADIGILVQTVVPLYVQTKFIDKFHPPRLLTHSAEEYVESAIKTIGIEHQTNGTLCHSIQAIIISSLPQFAKNFFSAWIQKKRLDAVLKSQ